MRKRYKIPLIVFTMLIIGQVGFGFITGDLRGFLVMFDSGASYCESNMLSFKYSGIEFDDKQILDELKLELEHNYDSSYVQLIDSSRIIKLGYPQDPFYAMKFVNDLQTNSTETIAIMASLEKINDISEVTGPYGGCVAP